MGSGPDPGDRPSYDTYGAVWDNFGIDNYPRSSASIDAPLTAIEEATRRDWRGANDRGGATARTTAPVSMRQPPHICDWTERIVEFRYGNRVGREARRGEGTENPMNHEPRD